MKQRIWALAAMLGASLALSGCGSSKTAEPFEPLKLPLDRIGMADYTAIPWPVLNADFLDPGYVNRLTPYETGPGIAVCEPAGAADPAALAFGRGAARWLQLALSSQMALERMPTFTSVTRALERGAVPYALTPAIAARIQHCTGATHALTSRIDTQGLSLQLYSLPDGKAVGDRIQVAGSQDQIASRLPSSVEKIVAAVGAKAEGVMPQAETAGALRTAGSALRTTSADAARIGKNVLSLAPTSDLAALMAIEACSASLRPELATEVLEKLPARAKENPLLWASGGRASVRLGFQSAPEDIAGGMALVKAHPRHYLANLAAAAMWACARQPAEAMSYASEAVRCNAQSPEAWRVLSEGYGSQSDAIRNGRSYQELNAEEEAGLESLYRAQARSARKATEIDPAGSENWLMLSLGARYLGDRKTASEALWRAMNMKPLNYQVVVWGLTLYSSMWDDDPRMLRRVQNVAASSPLASSRDRELVLAALQQYSRFDLVRKMKGMPAPRIAAAPAAAPPQVEEEPQASPEPPTPAQKPAKADLAARRKQLDQMAEEALANSGVDLKVIEASPAPQPQRAAASARSAPQPATAGQPPAPSSDDEAPIPIEKISGSQVTPPAPSAILARTRQTLFSLAWDPTGKRLAGAGLKGTLFIVPAPGKRFDLRGHTGSVYAVAWSPNGESLASCGADGTVRLWDAATGKPAAVLKGHAGPVRSVDWSARGQLASGGDDRTIRLWDAVAKNQIRKLAGHSALVGGVAFSPEGRRLFSTGAVVGAGEGIVWDVATGKPARKIDVIAGYLQSIAWSPDGKSLAVVKRKSVALFDATSGEPQDEIETETGFPPISLLWKNGCGLVAGIGNRNLITIKPGEIPLPESLSTGESLPTAIAWNPVTKRLATAQNDGFVREWSPTSEGAR